MTSMAVVIVNYNTRGHLRVCLRSVLAETPTEVVVADNGSADGSSEMVRSEFPRVVLLVNGANPGYGAAANAAIAHCRAEYVLLLNSDTVLRPGALDALRKYLDANPRAAIVGPRLVNPDGTLQRSCHQFPTPLVILLEYSWVGRVFRRIPGLRLRHLGSFAHDRSRAVPWVMGAALAIRRSAFEAVGGFDRSFFMYYEEVDLSYRLWRRAWETHFAPVTDVTHFGGASTVQQPSDMFPEQLAAALHYVERHHTRERVTQTWFVLKFAMFGKLVADTARYHVTRDAVQRRRLAGRIALWRSVLGQPWPHAAR